MDAVDTTVLEEALQANLTIQGMLTAYLSEINETLVRNLPSFPPSLPPAFHAIFSQSSLQQHARRLQHTTRARSTISAP